MARGVVEARGAAVLGGVARGVVVRAVVAARRTGATRGAAVLVVAVLAVAALGFVAMAAELAVAAALSQAGRKRRRSCRRFRSLFHNYGKT